ncbi:uncharacterized protein LOC119109253 [Pollicipes pollicipes]|uniref:uncharacterized protein LOC119109253 n=1 Tax=Pollicipes pollicipes TaxID=41117 RepID=UPI001884ED24|nr:uncharacterized protein LOC119109253 [Pollicipes pollicipes]
MCPELDEVVNKKDGTGRTPLMLAVENGSAELTGVTGGTDGFVTGYPQTSAQGPQVAAAGQHQLGASGYPPSAAAPGPAAAQGSGCGSAEPELTFLDNHPDCALVGTEFMLLVNASFSNYFVCTMCFRRMNDEAEAIAHLQTPFHRTMYLERYFPRAFKRLGEGLTSSQRPWTAATFQQLEVICTRIQERYGRMAPGIVDEAKFLTDALSLKRIIDERSHFYETHDISYFDLPYPFFGPALTPEQMPRLNVGTVQTMTSCAAGGAAPPSATAPPTAAPAMAGPPMAGPPMAGPPPMTVPPPVAGLGATGVPPSVDEALGSLHLPPPGLTHGPVHMWPTQPPPAAAAATLPSEPQDYRDNGKTHEQVEREKKIIESEIKRWREETATASTVIEKKTIADINLRPKDPIEARYYEAAKRKAKEMEEKEEGKNKTEKKGKSEGKHDEKKGKTDIKQDEKSKEEPKKSSREAENKESKQARSKKETPDSKETKENKLPKTNEVNPKKSAIEKGGVPAGGDQIAVMELITSDEDSDQMNIPDEVEPKKVVRRRPGSRERRHSPPPTTAWRDRWRRSPSRELQLASRHHWVRSRSRSRERGRRLAERGRRSRERSRERSRHTRSRSRERADSPPGRGRGSSASYSELRERRFKFERLEKNLLGRLATKKAVFDRRPEDHPDYAAEWKKFWERRYKEVQREGKNPDTYEYTPEWKTAWEEYIDELFVRERHEKRQELLAQYDLIEDEDGALVDALGAARRADSPWESGRSRGRSASTEIDHRQLSCNPSPPGAMTLERPDTGVSTLSASSAGEAARAMARPTKVDLPSVLRVLTALEDQLGSFAGPTNALLTQAVAAERLQPGSSVQLIAVTNNVLLMDTLKEKLKGQIAAGILAPANVSASRLAIDQIAMLLQDVPAHVFEPPLTAQQLADRVAGSVSSNDPMVISQQIAVTLTSLGRTNVSEAELNEILIKVMIAKGLLPSEPPAPAAAPPASAAPVPAAVPPVAATPPIATPLVATPPVAAPPLPASAPGRPVSSFVNTFAPASAAQPAVSAAPFSGPLTSGAPLMAPRATPLFNAYADDRARQPQHGLGMLQSAYDDDELQAEAPPPAREYREPVTNPPAPEADDELSAEQIHALLNNFDTLSRPEQEQLMEYLKKLEREKNDKVEQLKVLLARDPIKTPAQKRPPETTPNGSGGAEEAGRTSAPPAPLTVSSAPPVTTSAPPPPSSAGAVKPQSMDLSKLLSKEAIETALQIAKQLQTGALKATSPSGPAAAAAPPAVSAPPPATTYPVPNVVSHERGVPPVNSQGSGDSPNSDHAPAFSTPSRWAHHKQQRPRPPLPAAAGQYDQYNQYHQYNRGQLGGYATDAVAGYQQDFASVEGYGKGHGYSTGGQQYEQQEAEEEYVQEAYADEEDYNEENDYENYANKYIDEEDVAADP